MYKVWIIATTLCIFSTIVTSQIKTFSNPVLDIPERDASIIKLDEFYYLVHTDNEERELQILKSQFLTDFRNAENSVIYQLPPGYTAFFPSSLLKYKTELYLYFHMRSASVPLRMFVTKANNIENPLGTWTAPVRVLEPTWNENSNHGAVLEFNEQLYFVWTSVTESNPNRSIYIAKMNNPLDVVEPVVLLREPKETWECVGICSLEAPSFLYTRDKVYMAFSAGHNSLESTSISYMSINQGMDPMQASNWVAASGPVFQGNFEDNVYSTRFPEFTSSPDGTETWMLYTASSNASDINPSSRIRIEKVEWNSTDGTPKFPVARANGYSQALPSGESPKFLNPILDEFLPFSNAHRLGDYYYIALLANSEITMLRSDKLYDFRSAEKKVIYRASEDLTVFAAARIIQINGNLFLYFSMQKPNEAIYMYVIKAENGSEPLQNWGSEIKLLDGAFDENALDGTVLELNSKLYFVWANKNNATHNVIYIAPMRNPTEVNQSAVLLKEPIHAWECEGNCINDFPSVWYKKNTAFLFFAAGANYDPDTSLSYISIETGRDPLDTSSWYRAPGPVFVRNDAETVFAPSHVTFTSSPDGTETWMLYEASNNATDVTGNLKIRLEKVTWDELTGNPIFPMAHGFTHPQPIPSQCHA